ncbi:MAG: hypothetical protein ACXV8Q_19585 [Methylobacter sp.]
MTIKFFEFNDGTQYLADDCIDGCLINPVLPEDFDNKDLSERSPEEMKLWEGMPYITAVTWEDMKPDNSYEEFIERMGEVRNWKNPSREEWEQQSEQRRKSWFEAWPTGTRYDTRCLDGGAWDRSTWWGSFANIDEALACAKSGPSWS